MLVGGRVEMGEETCEASEEKTPCLYKYTYFMRETNLFHIIKMLQVSSLLKELNGELFLKHSFFLIKVFCKIGFS